MSNAQGKPVIFGDFPPVGAEEQTSETSPLSWIRCMVRPGSSLKPPQDPEGFESWGDKCPRACAQMTPWQNVAVLLYKGHEQKGTAYQLITPHGCRRSHSPRSLSNRHQWHEFNDGRFGTNRHDSDKQLHVNQGIGAADRGDRHFLTQSSLSLPGERYGGHHRCHRPEHRGVGSYLIRPLFRGELWADGVDQQQRAPNETARVYLYRAELTLAGARAPDGLFRQRRQRQPQFRDAFWELA